MILEAETLIEYGYLPLDLKLQSHKPILAACDKCGKIKVTTKNAYRTLCHSCSMKTEETKANMSAAQKGNINTLGHTLTEEHKAKISAATKGKTFTEEHKTKLSAAKKGKYCGENSPNWQGGISFEPYCIKFNNAYKQLIRTKFNNRCFWCGKTTEESDRALDVHHVNYNKQCGCDESKCICVPLCRRCHSKTNTDRDGWQEKIMKKLELSGILWGN